MGYTESAGHAGSSGQQPKAIKEGPYSAPTLTFVPVSPEKGEEKTTP